MGRAFIIILCESEATASTAHEKYRIHPQVIFQDLRMDVRWRVPGRTGY